MTLLYDSLDRSYRYIDGEDPAIVKIMPSGVYTVVLRPDGMYFNESYTHGDNLVEVDTEQSRQFRKEIRDFFDDNITSVLTESGISHRRGIILYGEQGSGKTSLVRSSLPYILSFNSIVLIGPDPGYLEGHCIPAIRDDDADRPIVIIWDDFERVIEYHYSIIQLLDGIKSPDHLLVICTTNNIDAIPPQIKNRPSRFGLIMDIPRLPASSRYNYVVDKFPRISISDAWWLVEVTISNQLDYLQEACKLHLMGYSREEIIARISLAWHGKDNNDKDLYDIPSILEDADTDL